MTTINHMTETVRVLREKAEAADSETMAALYEAEARGIETALGAVSAPVSGDLISREAAIAAVVRNGADCLGAEDALRALPAATDAGEVERLRADIEELQGAQIVNRTAIRLQKEARERAEARIAELEDEVEGYHHWGDDVKRLTRQIDVDLHGEEGAAKQASLCDLAGAGKALREKLEADRDALVAGAIEAAAQWLIETGMAGDAPDDPLASCIRALTTADAKASLDRLIADAVQAALPKGDPVAWVQRRVCGALLVSEPGEPEVTNWSAAFPVYAHPAPTNAGVTVKPPQVAFRRGRTNEPFADGWTISFGDDAAIFKDGQTVQAFTIESGIRRILAALEPASAGDDAIASSLFMEAATRAHASVYGEGGK